MSNSGVHQSGLGSRISGSRIISHHLFDSVTISRRRVEKMASVNALVSRFFPILFAKKY
jgi:hypothetical protein